MYLSQPVNDSLIHTALILPFGIIAYLLKSNDQHEQLLFIADSLTSIYAHSLHNLLAITTRLISIEQSEISRLLNIEMKILGQMNFMLK